MSEQIFNYEAKYNWETKADHPNIPSRPYDNPYTEEEISPELMANMEAIAVEKFVSELAKIGHWYRINSVTTNITYFHYKGRDFPPMPRYIIKGETIVNFDSDIEVADLEESPSLLAAITLAILAIVAAILAHPVLFLSIILVIAFAILASQLANLGTGVIDIIKEPAGAISTILLLVIILLFVLFYFGGFSLGGTKKRRRKKK